MFNRNPGLRGLVPVGLILAASIAVVSAQQRGGQGAGSPPPPRPWMDMALSADQRAGLVLAEMTLDEKIGLLHGMGRGGGSRQPAVQAVAARSNGGAGFVPGVPRLGIPDLQMADAAVGVARGAARSRYSTALPSTLAEAATWDPKIAVRLRRAHRPGAARPGLQRVARRRRQPHARAAQRPQLRVPGRGPDSGRDDGRPAHEGPPGPARHRRHQALRAQRPGDRPQHRQRDARQARAAGDRPAGLRDRASRIGKPGR